MKIEVNGTDFHLTIHHSKMFLRAYAEHAHSQNAANMCSHIMESVRALDDLEKKIAEALPDGELRMIFGEDTRDAEPQSNFKQWNPDTPFPPPAAPIEIPEQRSRATQKAIEAAADLTAEQVLRDKFILMTPQGTLDGAILRRAIWMDRQSGYLFLGLREVMQLMQRPDRVCASCMTQWQDHESSGLDDECETGFILSPCLARDRESLAQQQRMLWDQVKLFQLEQAGYRAHVQGSGHGWIDRNGRYFADLDTAWRQMNADVAALYMRECVLCGRQLRSHDEMQRCPGSDGSKVYLSRMQALLSEHAPSLGELLRERDRPLTDQERRG